MQPAWRWNTRFRKTPLAETGTTAGALDGVRVLDFSRQAPGPYSSMLLADFGADVVLVEPPGSSTRGEATNRLWELEVDPEVSSFAALRRNKRSIVLDLKATSDRTVIERLIAWADVVIEGFRPGVATRLGVDYEQCKRINSQIVYCSITGYGQRGPRADEPGHDINFLGYSGLLSAISTGAGEPVIPMNIIGDFGGGGSLAAFAIMVALFHRHRSGVGQFVDLAMLDGVYSLSTHAASLYFARSMDMRGGRYFLSGGLPHYNVYRCSDERWMAVGALEPWFVDRLMAVTGRPDLAGAHRSPERFPEMRQHLENWFAARTRAEAAELLQPESICATPVLDFAEAMEEGRRRGIVTEVGGVPQVGIAPRLSVTPGRIRRPPPQPGEHNTEIRNDEL